jgi:kynurenine formamidase
MGRKRPGHYGASWTPPEYTVDENHRVVGAVPPEPNNWGRWGLEDERGTTNLITPEVITAAAGLIRSGRALSLAIAINADAPVHFTRPKALRLQTISGSDYITGQPINAVYNEGLQWTDDVLFMALQGSTQWDGLAHLVRDDVMYNGFWSGAVTASGGAARNGIQHQRETLSGRGVLLDVCRHRGGEPLKGGDVITGAELDAVAASQGVEIRSGDMVLVRTGYLGAWYQLDAVEDYVAKTVDWWNSEPGLSIDVLDWLHVHDAAAVAVDNWGVEPVPFESDSGRPFPFHQGAIPGLGLTLGEFWWLDDLGRACEEEQRWEFFLAAQPLNVTNASGTPLNPIAIL